MLLQRPDLGSTHVPPWSGWGPAGPHGTRPGSTHIPRAPGGGQPSMGQKPGPHPKVQTRPDRRKASPRPRTQLGRAWAEHGTRLSDLERHRLDGCDGCQRQAASALAARVPARGACGSLPCAGRARRGRGSGRRRGGPSRAGSRAPRAPTPRPGAARRTRPRADAHVDRALDVDADAGIDRQPSSTISSSPARPLELGVDQRDQRRVLADAVDEQPLRDADLRSGQARRRVRRSSARPSAAPARAARRRSGRPPASPCSSGPGRPTCG